ncbi:MAG: glutaminase A [Cyanobacteria bacterium P01_H01_bin.21]
MMMASDFRTLSNRIKAVASPFQTYLGDLHQRYQSLLDGNVASYIPELEKANPKWFGISVVTPSGDIYAVGDCRQLFTIQSISKAFVYGLALEVHGRETILNKIGVEPTGEAFNTITLDEKTNRPYNPMINAGAIATTDLIPGCTATDRLKLILEMFRRYTGRRVYVDSAVASSERATGSRNRAIAYLMHDFGMISDRVDETLDLYFQQCSILIDCHDLAIIGATLANNGVNPMTGERAIEQRYVQDVLSIMHSCGVYDYSGEWLYRVGIPAKSGVGGGIVAVAPDKLSIGVFSPCLDSKGNSARGIRVCQTIAEDLGLHLFNATQPNYDFQI